MSREIIHTRLRRYPVILRRAIRKLVVTDAGIEAFKPPPPVIPDPLPPLSELPQRDALLAAITQVDYLAANPDLPGVIKSDEDARAHFDAKGFHQNRRWKPGLLDYFDTKYYRRRYSRLPLSSAAAAERHYALVGIFEGRFPNLATEHMWNARIHLFQMGKVGSKAIEAGIAVASGESCIHVHWADFWEQQRPHIRIPYSQLLAHPRKQPVLVLTGVRDPFSRLVSGWFQEFESRKRDRSLMTWEQAKKEISARFHSDALRIVNWFEHRFYCELDVYAQPFDTTAGYVTLEHPWMLVFVYRQDALPRLIEPLREFLGMPNFNLEPSNISNQKWYADVYRQTFEQFRLPEDAVKACLATQYMQHFFTEAERADMANRWID